ncbi:MAG: hypothetical protein C0507_01360 [Cyanobacteria bacterium PR.3.49]|nr:hypothetical protein [Cyanobacteria bacterium PR.3.49]
MKMPNLFWRGMIITMIPLLFQLIIIAFLAHYLLTIKNEILLESRSQEIIARAFVLNRDAMETIYNLSTTFEELPQQHPKLYADDTDPIITLNENLQRLFDVARVDGESAEKMRELYSCHKQVIEMIKDARNQVFQNRRHRLSARQIYFRKFIQIAGEYSSAANSIVALEESIQTKRPKIISSLLSQVWATLYAALAISALLAFLLGYLYIALVKRPLKRTCENGRLLAKGQTLPPPVEGSDELATLDRLLHSTADALEKVEQDEKRLVENAADLICSLSQDGAFTSANPFAFRMLGWTPENLMGRNLHDLTVPEESLVCDEKLRETRGSPDIKVFDLRLQTATDTVIDTRWSCFWSEAQHVFFCVAHDITETRNAERMKQDLVDMISHDLRSPLTSVSISLAILSRGAKGEFPAEEKRKLDLAGKTVEQLIELVSDLLDFQKLNAKEIALETSHFKISQICQKALKTTESHAEKKAISIDISGDAQLNGDKSLLAQALAAALENAVKAAPDGSTVRCEVTEIGDFVQVRVIDDGEGLSDDEIDQIALSVPMQKLSSGGNRSLLKFSICKKIVEAHEGNINFYNVKPHGWSFSMRLPAGV